MKGQRLKHYRVVDLLGKGGMGEVYVAEDSLLKRRVALKVLPPGVASDPHLRARFEREAQAVAALNHPNIVTIHSIEEAEGLRFLTMELVDGRRLADCIPESGMPLDELLAVGLPLVDALCCAHARGIVHRDLKPANVMLDSEGRVKVLDFGLAKLGRDDGTEAAPTADTRTEMTGGLVVGTLPYMAPEQLQGEPVDHRADIFALGVVLYEMATGRRPFQGKSSAAVISSILRDAPQGLSEGNPELAPELERIVLRCLEKEPDQRYRSTRDVADDLRRLHGDSTAGSTPMKALHEPIAVLDRPAVAVLPFANLSGEPEQQYFVDGIAQDIVTTLSYWRWFPVIAWNSTQVYRGEAVNVVEVGRKLGARYVLEGSVRKARDRVRITAQLADASSGHQIWAQRYDRDLTDIFGLQDEITEQIVGSIEPELSRAEQRRALRKVPENLDAWDYCQRALFHEGSGTRSAYDTAIDLLGRAIALDPRSSYAHATLAWFQYYRAIAGWSEDPAHAFLQSFESACRAVELDDADWTGHYMKGMGHLWTRREFDGGIEENRRAVALNPSAARAYHGLACLLSFSGRWSEAIPELHKVLKLDPHYVYAASVLADLTLAHLMLREFDEALEFATKAVHKQVSFVRAHQRLVCCLGHMDRREQSELALRALLQRQRDFSVEYVDATYPFKNSEDRGFFLEGFHKAGWRPASERSENASGQT